VKHTPSRGVGSMLPRKFEGIQTERLDLMAFQPLDKGEKLFYM